jgi:hypothetical protein
MTRKPYSCTLHEDIIKTIRQTSLSRGISQGEFITEAITSHLSGNDDFMDSSLDSNEVLIMEQFNALKEELFQKNQQIKTLMESQIQANHIIARFQQKQYLIESNKDSEIIKPNVQKSKQKQSKQRDKKQSKKKRRSKKKKK